MKGHQPRTRLQLDFEDQAIEKLEELRKVTGARTKGDVVRNALRVYEWLLKQRTGGFRLEITNGDITREVDLIIG